MKRLTAIFLALTLILALPAAFASTGVRLESLEYKGFGVIEVEFSRETSWYPDATFTMTGLLGEAVEITPFAGEDENAYLYAPGIVDGGSYSLQMVFGAVEQRIDFTAVTGTEYRINKNDAVTTREDKEKCDFCRERGHDEDFCPERINPGDIPSDPEGLAWYFDVDDFCDRCGGFGHDDDNCKNR